MQRQESPPKHPRNDQREKLSTLLLSPFEWTITRRYMMPGKGEGFIALVAGISVGVVMLSVALLVVVMSVMNGSEANCSTVLSA